MNTINSKAVRNEVRTMQLNNNSFTDKVSHRKPNKDRAVILGFVIAMVSTLAVLSALGLIPKY